MKRLLASVVLSICFVAPTKADDRTIVEGLVMMAVAGQYCGIPLPEAVPGIVDRLARKYGADPSVLARNIGKEARQRIVNTNPDALAETCRQVSRTYHYMRAW